MLASAETACLIESTPARFDILRARFDILLMAYCRFGEKCSGVQNTAKAEGSAIATLLAAIDAEVLECEKTIVEKERCHTAPHALTQADFPDQLSTVYVSLHTHNHTLTTLPITCTCCYNEIKGTQDKDFTLSFADSLSHGCIRL